MLSLSVEALFELLLLPLNFILVFFSLLNVDVIECLKIKISLISTKKQEKKFKVSIIF